MKRGVYFPHWYNLQLAREIAQQTRNPEYKGKIVPRRTPEVLMQFAKRRSAVKFSEGVAVAHAGITHVFPLPDGKKLEEVGSVMSWGEHRNGNAQDVTTALVRRRRRQNRTHIAMVAEDNKASIRLFEEKLHGRRMAKSEVPDAVYSEVIPGTTAGETVFDITNI